MRGILIETYKIFLELDTWTMFFLAVVSRTQRSTIQDWNAENFFSHRWKRVFEILYLVGLRKLSHWPIQGIKHLRGFSWIVALRLKLSHDPHWMAEKVQITRCPVPAFAFYVLAIARITKVRIWFDNIWHNTNSKCL